MPFRLSTKGHYAVQLMYELALQNGSYASLQEISAARNISQGYLEHIIRPLRKGGLVSSKRGFGGGYALRRPMEAITVGDIIRAVEGPVIPVRCVAADAVTDACPDDCKARAVWRKVGQAIDDVLDSITLGSLVSDEPLPEGDL